MFVGQATAGYIDGEGTGDATPLGHLAFEANRQREQLAIDESGGATDGNIYATRSASDVLDVFSSSGEYKGTLTESTATGAFGEPCGVAVDSSGNVYVGDRGLRSHPRLRTRRRGPRQRRQRRLAGRKPAGRPRQTCTTRCSLESTP